MIRIFTFGLTFFVLLYFVHGDKYISVNCQNKKYAYFKDNKWIDIRKLKICPIGNKLIELCNKVYNDKFTSVEQVIDERMNLCKNSDCEKTVYNCVRFDTSSKQSNDESQQCVIRHEEMHDNTCRINLEWIKLANMNCHKDAFELHQISGIAPCYNSSEYFMAIQFVCCPQLDAYKRYFKSKAPTSVAEENRLYIEAKRVLRLEFRKRQEQINNQFIKNEKDLTIWDKYPKLASKIEKSFQNDFRKNFVMEIETEVNQLKELEFEHENRLQKIYDDNRKIADDRNIYVLQEMSDSLEEKISRVSKALRIELNKILDEAQEKRDFLNRMIVEGLLNDKSVPSLTNKITNDFHLIIDGEWQSAIDNLDSRPDIKPNVLNSMKDLSEKREKLIKEFNVLLNNKEDASLPGYQAETSVNNYINEYGHNNGRRMQPSQTVSSPKSDIKRPISLRNEVELISIICLSVLVLILIIGAILIVYRNSRRINSVLTHTVKKWRPISANCSDRNGRSCKPYNRHILHVPTVPLNGSNNINDQYQFSTHSYILNPSEQLKQIHEQTITSSNLIDQYDLSSNSIGSPYLSVEQSKQEPIIIDFTLRTTNENSMSNYMDNDDSNNYTNENFSDGTLGLENSICRLLDEK